ncbi:PilZ domain-containing protein [Bradyrhizobium sp. RDM12]
MVETRHAPRFRACKPALIERGGDTTRCTIRDISTTGAALQFSDWTDGIPRSSR